MALPNVFEPNTTDTILARISTLNPQSQPQWGKMNVAQMLAHCNVTYELALENKHPEPNAFMRFILKNLVKKTVTNEVPYKKNSGTAPVFKVAAEQDFEKEKLRLADYIKKVQELGSAHFEGKKSHSFGILTAQEWNNMFYKHLDHHLGQFGA